MDLRQALARQAMRIVEMALKASLAENAPHLMPPVDLVQAFARQDRAGPGVTVMARLMSPQRRLVVRLAPYLAAIPVVVPVVMLVDGDPDNAQNRKTGEDLGEIIVIGARHTGAHGRERERRTQKECRKQSGHEATFRSGRAIRRYAMQLGLSVSGHAISVDC